MHRELRVVDDCPFMHALAGSTPAEVVAMTRELTEVVIRDDDTGLIAEVTSMFFDRSINIEDLDQAVREGVFRMTMRVDTSEMIVKGEDAPRKRTGAGATRRPTTKPKQKQATNGANRRHCRLLSALPPGRACRAPAGRPGASVRSHRLWSRNHT